MMPATDTSGTVSIDQDNIALLDVQSYGAINSILNEETIYEITGRSHGEKARSSVTINSPIEVGGVVGFQVVYSTGFKEYYVKRSIEDPIINISIYTDNTTTQKILSTFRFVK